MCVEHIKSPLSNAKRKIEHMYTGPQESDLVDMMVQCDSDVSLIFVVYYQVGSYKPQIVMLLFI